MIVGFMKQFGNQTLWLGHKDYNTTLISFTKQLINDSIAPQKFSQITVLLTGLDSRTVKYSTFS